MLDAIVDRREMKDAITRILRFGGAAAPTTPSLLPAPAEAAAET